MQRSTFSRVCINKSKTYLDRRVKITNEAPLSPVQCAVYLPEPANVERDRTNGRLLRMAFIAL